jgi:hypothetical protein
MRRSLNQAGVILSSAHIGSGKMAGLSFWRIIAGLTLIASIAGYTSKGGVC